LRVALEFPKLRPPEFLFYRSTAVKIPVTANMSTRFTGTVVIGVPAGVLVVANPIFKH
jgi:hypothetical protein